ncbi:MAG TPA: alpha/beta fold hydrolase [Acidimicrobiales bacterium]|nr:alpha/beta fold hydrolase [Acidimicrobiales bacterium]
MSDLFIEAWGTGAPVVLVHGSLATGAEEWQAQQPLADEGYQLLVLDRRGYGESPAVEGEDFLRDAADIAHVIGNGTHVVAHSYGGLGAMFAAAQRPEAIHSLALLEPAATTLASTDAARDLVDAIRNMWDQDLPDKVWLARFLEAVGTDIETLPAEILEGAAPLVPVLRKGRPAWDREPPVAELAAARFPKLVVSGGHSEGFEAICDELADQIRAARAVVEGAGHEIQFTGAPINDALRNLWARAG